MPNQAIKKKAQPNVGQFAPILGLAPDPNSGYLVISCFLPQAQQVEIIDKKTRKSLGQLNRINEHGLFQRKLRRKRKFEYQIQFITQDQSELIEHAGQFPPTLSDFDIHLLAEGNHHFLHKVLGAHPCIHHGIAGTAFTVWAPNANTVSVVGDFNHWQGEQHVMQNVNYSGYWNLFIPQVGEGALYKYQITDPQQNTEMKADPCASQSELRPNTASVVAAPLSKQWQDDLWLKQRAARNSRNAAISIYEVHLGSWRRDENNDFLNYRDIAKQLIPYVKDMGFTHIQLMPISEYPFDGSWGYQPVGLFAPTSRFGSRADFQYFIEQCHIADIGVLVDWVPGHFPNDPHGLAQFDGSHLYEHQDPKQGFHPDWNTLIYNYGRTEVANFLRSSAIHWLSDYHVDGIRVDAVASMLYLDYSRKEGEWIPNKFGGRENLEAIDFIKRFNTELYAAFPDAMTVAEESTSWPGVSAPVDNGGLGFGYKWNMGWMNDSLEYMKRDPVHRPYHHNELSFSLVYAFNENFILPLSHDEVVHGKGSILARMPGDAWQQFANLRAYYGFMWAHPGKKLLFMGSEFAQGREWNHDQPLDWHQLDIDWHQQVQSLVKQLNTVYTNTPALHVKDCESDGFVWLDHDNAQQSTYSFIRFGQAHDEPVVVVSNFAPSAHYQFRIGLPKAGKYRLLVNTDANELGGSDVEALFEFDASQNAWQQQAFSAEITIPPLATIMYQRVAD
ncbi:1,4-alpha-glucan branching protein GlgB [Thalassotalea fusca]